MKSKIDFEESLKDSPQFRTDLEEAENDISTLEGKIEKVIKLCNAMLESGRAYGVATGLFLTGIQDLSQYFSDDKFVKSSFDKFLASFMGVQNYQKIMLDQCQFAVSQQLKTFLLEDVKKIKDTKKVFDKTSDDLDTALVKNSQVSRNKPAEMEEALNVLTATKSAFGHTALDYAFQINIFQSKKYHELLSRMLAFMHAQFTYFHQGYDKLKSLDPFLNEVFNKVSQLKSEGATEKKEMEEKHASIQHMEFSKQIPPKTPIKGSIKMEGYLFKRSSKKHTFKIWNRRWFIIKNHELVYQKRSKDNLTALADLRLCNVKAVDDTDRRFCFELLSPPNKSCMLQADSDALRNTWIEAIEAGISTAINHQDSPKIDFHESEEARISRVPSDQSIPPSSGRSSQEKLSSILSQLQSIPGNDKCCDCKSKDPRWASINLGITLCIECSGIHRSLGVQLSKVRSLTLDAWEPETKKVMHRLGNDIINQIYESKIDESIAKPASPRCSRVVRETWITHKYVKKSFVQRYSGLEEELHNRSRANSRLSLRRKQGSGGQTASQSASPKEGSGQTTDQSASPKEESGQATGQSVSPQLATNRSKKGSASSTSYLEVPAVDKDESGESSSSEEVEPQDPDQVGKEWGRLTPNALLYRSAAAGSLGVMAQALALQADPNWVNGEDRQRVAIHQAVLGGSLAASEFLLLNGARVNVKDSEGKTPLHHATWLGHTGQACLLLKRGANQHAIDAEGQDVLAVALSTTNADIVTLLRLAKLNEEMKESDDFGQGGDETFQSVFRDFTNMASNMPEKLDRSNSKN